MRKKTLNRRILSLGLVGLVGLPRGFPPFSSLSFHFIHFHFIFPFPPLHILLYSQGPCLRVSFISVQGGHYGGSLSFQPQPLEFLFFFISSIAAISRGYNFLLRWSWEMRRSGAYIFHSIFPFL
jgi:hypothetical protein